MYKHSDRPGCNLHHFCLPALSFTLPLFLFIFWLSVLFCLSMRSPSPSWTAHFCLLLIMMPHNHDPGMNHFMIYISSVLKYFFLAELGFVPVYSRRKMMQYRRHELNVDDCIPFCPDILIAFAAAGFRRRFAVFFFLLIVFGNPCPFTKESKQT